MNLRPLPPQGSALPTAPHPDFVWFCVVRRVLSVDRRSLTKGQTLCVCAVCSGRATRSFPKSLVYYIIIESKCQEFFSFFCSSFFHFFANFFVFRSFLKVYGHFCLFLYFYCFTFILLLHCFLLVLGASLNLFLLMKRGMIGLKLFCCYLFSLARVNSDRRDAEPFTPKEMILYLRQQKCDGKLKTRN